MRIAIIGDLHFIAPDDPSLCWREHRQHFAEAWDSFAQTLAILNDASPDLIILLGDLVDYYSDANRDFALQQLSHLPAPWLVTPGNHDFALADAGHSNDPDRPDSLEIRRRWAAAGVFMGNRCVEADGVCLLLVDSFDSNVPKGTDHWLRQSTENSKRNMLFTHVPLCTPEIGDYILSIQPQRNLRKYLQSGAPNLFDEAVHNRIEAVFSGHLHFEGRLTVRGTEMYLLPLGLCAFGKSYPDQGHLYFIDTEPAKTNIWRR